MIQRIQSLFLLGIIICMVMLLLFPIWEKGSEGTSSNSDKIELNTYSLKKYSQGKELILQNTLYLTLIALLIGGLASYELFNYKDRKLQRKIGAVNSLLLVLLLGSSYFLINMGIKMVEEAGDGTYKLGFFLIIISVVLNLLANRFIMRDERLVKSADRMRD